MAAKVEVCIRCRPVKTGDPVALAVQQTAQGAKVTVPEIKQTAELASERDYVFDSFWPGETSQESVFENVARPIVDRVLDGYMGTICCYGASGCGKSYTIFGEKGSEGILPRAMAYLLNAKTLRTNTKEITFVASFLEIYLDKVYDLLDDVLDPTMLDAPQHAALPRPGVPGAPAASSGAPAATAGPSQDAGATTTATAAAGRTLQLRENTLGAFYADGLSMHPVESVADFVRLHKTGMRRRATFSTRVNERSSRSHCIFSVACIQVDRVNSMQATSMLSLVDLAGAERLSKSASEGVRKLEAATINRSLSALGNVVQALARSSDHVPYRDSKLTRILASSLGGNCFTTMVCNVHPTVACHEETLSTLAFGHRCRNITNQPRISVIDLSQASAEERIRRLQAELAEARLLLDQETRRRLAAEKHIAGELGQPFAYGSSGELLLDGDPAQTGQPRHARRRGSARGPEAPGDGSGAGADAASTAILATQRDTIVSLQRRLEQKTVDMVDVQTRLRGEKEALLRGLSDARKELTAAKVALAACQQDRELEAAAAKAAHARELDTVMLNNARLLQQAADDTRHLRDVVLGESAAGAAQGDLERALRQRTEAEKLAFATELDSLMLRQREDLLRHFQKEMGLLRSEAARIERDQTAAALAMDTDLNRLHNCLRWLVLQYNLVATTLYDCAAGRFLVAPFNFDGLIASALSAGAAGATSRPGSSLCSRPSSGLSKTLSVAKSGNNAFVSATPSTQAPSRRPVSALSCHSHSTQSIAGAGHGHGHGQGDSATAAAVAVAAETFPDPPCGDFVETAVFARPKVPGAVCIPTDRLPATIPAEMAAFMKEHHDKLTDKEFLVTLQNMISGKDAIATSYLAASAQSAGSATCTQDPAAGTGRYLSRVTAPGSPFRIDKNARAASPIIQRGGVASVADPAKVHAARPASASGFSSIRPYSAYTKRPYDYEEGPNKTVRRCKARPLPREPRFAKVFGDSPPKVFSDEASMLVNNQYTSSGVGSVVSPPIGNRTLSSSTYYAGSNISKARSMSTLSGPQGSSISARTLANVYSSGPQYQSPFEDAAASDPKNDMAFTREANTSGNGRQDARGEAASAGAAGDVFDEWTSEHSQGDGGASAGGQPGAAEAASLTQTLYNELLQEKRKVAALKNASLMQLRMLQSSSAPKPAQKIVFYQK